MPAVCTEYLDGAQPCAAAHAPDHEAVHEGGAVGQEPPVWGGAADLPARQWLRRQEAPQHAGVGAGPHVVREVGDRRRRSVPTGGRDSTLLCPLAGPHHFKELEAVERHPGLRVLAEAWRHPAHQGLGLQHDQPGRLPPQRREAPPPGDRALRLQGGHGEGEHRLPRQRHGHVSASQDSPLRPGDVRRSEHQDRAAQHSAADPVNTRLQLVPARAVRGEHGRAHARPQALRVAHRRPAALRLRRHAGQARPQPLPEAPAAAGADGAALRAERYAGRGVDPAHGPGGHGQVRLHRHPERAQGAAVLEEPALQRHRGLGGVGVAAARRHRVRDRVRLRQGPVPRAAPDAPQQQHRGRHPLRLLHAVRRRLHADDPGEHLLLRGPGLARVVPAQGAAEHRALPV